MSNDNDNEKILSLLDDDIDINDKFKAYIQIKDKYWINRLIIEDDIVEYLDFIDTNLYFPLPTLIAFKYEDLLYVKNVTKGCLRIVPRILRYCRFLDKSSTISLVDIKYIVRNSGIVDYNDNIVGKEKLIFEILLYDKFRLGEEIEKDSFKLIKL